MCAISSLAGSNLCSVYFCVNNRYQQHFTVNCTIFISMAEVDMNEIVLDFVHVNKNKKQLQTLEKSIESFSSIFTYIFINEN